MTEKKRGELYLYAEIVLWSIFPIVTVLSYAALPALVSFALCSLVSAVFFAIVLTYKKRWSELRHMAVWTNSALAAFFIGVLFYGLYFFGLTMTTPGNASLIVLFEVCTTFILLLFLKQESLSVPHIGGALLMIVGALLVLSPNFSGLNGGDILIFIATFVSPIGNLFQWRARKIASSETVMFIRTVLSAPIICIAAFSMHAVSLSDIQASLPLLIINGFILLGLSKILWLEAIYRMPISKAISLQSAGPSFTLFFAWLILGQHPTMMQFASLVPLFFGVLLLTDHLKLPHSWPGHHASL